MKNLVKLLVFVLFFSWVGLAPVASAQAATESELEARGRAVDKEAKTPEGKRAVVDRLKSEFNVDQGQIDSLREKKYGYGEIMIAYSLAKEMPGGINDENMGKITDLREDKKTGWGNVAKELGVNQKLDGPFKPERPEKSHRGHK